MGLHFKDNCGETTNTTGTSDLVLTGTPLAKRQALGAADDGETVSYWVEDGSGTGWEKGRGAYTHSSKTVARTTIDDSSDGGSKITLSGTTPHNVGLMVGAAWFNDMEKYRLASTAYSTDADLAMEVGKLYLITMAAWASHNIASLPTTAAVGDIVGVYIVDGDADYELQLRTTAASDDTIDGVDYDSADLTRLFQAGEYYYFKCITANTAWITLDSRLIPTSCRIDADSGTNQELTDATWEQVTFFTREYYDNGGIGDFANDRIVPRRDGNYIVNVIAFMSSTTTGIVRCAAGDQSDNNVAASDKSYIAAAQGGAVITSQIYIDISVITEIRMRALQDSDGDYDLQATKNTYLEVIEQL